MVVSSLKANIWREREMENIISLCGRRLRMKQQLKDESKESSKPKKTTRMMMKNNIRNIKKRSRRCITREILFVSQHQSIMFHAKFVYPHCYPHIMNIFLFLNICLYIIPFQKGCKLAIFMS